MESNWLQEKVASFKEGTTVILTSQKEFDHCATSLVGPQATHQAFKDDLKMNKIVTFYHSTTGVRCVLVVDDSDSEKEENHIKTVRGLAKKVIGEL